MEIKDEISTFRQPQLQKETQPQVVEDILSVKEDGSRQEEREALLLKIQEKLLSLLERENPKYFNLHWIETAKRGTFLYREILSYIKMSESRESAVAEVMSGLPQEWAVRFGCGPSEESLENRNQKNTKWTMQKVVLELENFFDNNDGNFSINAVGDIDKTLSRAISKLLSSDERKITMDDIWDNLGHEYKERLEMPWTFRRIVAGVAEIIKNNDNAISSTDISSKNRALYEAICRHVRNDDLEVDLKKIKYALPLQYQPYLITKGKGYFNKKMSVVKDALANFDISHDDLGGDGYKLYKKLFNDLPRTEMEGIDWAHIFSNMKKDEAEKLMLLKNFVEKNILSEINQFVQQDKHENVNPALIKKENQKLFKKMKLFFIDENGDTDLMEIRNGIDQEFRDNFHFNRTKKSAFYELRDLLREERPQKITVKSLLKMNQELINFISRKNRTKKGYIDWPTIVSYWDEESRNKFAIPFRYQESLPNEQYEDDGEVKSALQENTKYLYTFFHAESKEEQEKRNDICLSLIRLAKRGNKLAEKELMNFMTFLTDKWQENVGLLQAFKYHKDRRNDVIFRCIYNYKEEKSFVGYVYKTLTDVAQGLQGTKEVEHREDFMDHNYDLENEYNDGTNGVEDDEYEDY